MDWWWCSLSPCSRTNREGVPVHHPIFKLKYNRLYIRSQWKASPAVEGDSNARSGISARTFGRISDLVGITGVRSARPEPTWREVLYAPFNLVWRPHLLLILIFEVSYTLTTIRCTQNGNKTVWISTVCCIRFRNWHQCEQHCLLAQPSPVRIWAWFHHCFLDLCNARCKKDRLYLDTSIDYSDWYPQR